MHAAQRPGSLSRVRAHVRYAVTAPVEIHGTAVKPDDIIHGDANGWRPSRLDAEDALKRCVDQVRSREMKLMDQVRGDRFSLDGLRDLTVE